MIAARLRLGQAALGGDGVVRPLKVLAGVTLVALAVSVVARAFVGLGDPLWLDETWTGAFASERSPAALVYQVRNDVNAPVYYVLMFIWAKLFGLSNVALRAPSVVFSLVAPVAAWCSLRTRQPAVALVWCALLALWLPGFELSGDARCYSLLTLTAVLNVWAFIRVLETPDLQRTGVWVASAALAVLTHYHAAFLAVAEAGIFLAVQRQRALALWPAAFAAAPALMWIAYHAPRLASFARPGVAWYNPLTLADLPSVLTFLFGSALGLPTVTVCLIVGLLLSRSDTAETPQLETERSAALKPLWLTGLAAVLGVFVCLVVGAIRPSFTLRYLTPFVPGVVMLLAAAVVKFGRGRWEPPVLLVAGFGGVALLWVSQTHPGDRVYNFEQASAWLALGAPTRLAFFWDHPATPMEAPRQLDQVGGFFLRRAGLPVTVAPLIPRPGMDMNRAVLDAAGPQGAILWLYDTSVHGTQAITQPPRIAAIDPGYTCRNFGSGFIGIIACRKEAHP